MISYEESDKMQCALCKNRIGEGELVYSLNKIIASFATPLKDSDEYRVVYDASHLCFYNNGNENTEKAKTIIFHNKCWKSITNEYLFEE